jgi:HlyD family secretion protein
MKRTDALEFAPDFSRVVHSAPAPLPRAVLYVVVALLLIALVWANIGKLDVVAVSQGKLIPQSFLKIVQPAEGGVVREILVKEGEAVRAGQVLVRMDSRLSGADVRMLEDELARRRLQLRRIDAELAGRALDRADDDPPDLFAQVTAHLAARRQAHLDALGAEQALRARAEHDMASAAEIESKLSQTVPIYREQEKAWEQLAREGYAGRLLALDRQRSRIEADQELKAQSRNIESMKAMIAQAEKRIAQIQSSYRQQLHNERSEAQGAYHKLQQEWEKQGLRHQALDLKAPEDGIVKDLATHTPGTVLAPGTIVLTLVPQHEPLLAQVWVSNSDAGFVQRGQKVRIKLAAYPFQKYGLLDGTVEQVSADAQDKAAAAEGTLKALPELAYRALVSLDPRGLALNGERLKLTPGMVVTAEMHIGRRTVMEYVLSPLQKIGAEAARER